VKRNPYRKRKRTWQEKIAIAARESKRRSPPTPSLYRPQTERQRSRSSLSAGESTSGKLVLELASYSELTLAQTRQRRSSILSYLSRLNAAQRNRYWQLKWTGSRRR